ncbi:hypothetical protein EVAR_102705_1 [Eumeta japonica]|uniref:Uncharacterized protein n=1 Tax=Eumeta variegata TaxID=151549 RepID=A0A4C1TKP5_EUMVA|nr:hypothetical protein EVAR_102705_1 [Eumeta japonica]
MNRNHPVRITRAVHFRNSGAPAPAPRRESESGRDLAHPLACSVARRAYDSVRGAAGGRAEGARPRPAQPCAPRVSRTPTKNLFATLRAVSACACVRLPRNAHGVAGTCEHYAIGKNPIRSELDARNRGAAPSQRSRPSTVQRTKLCRSELPANQMRAFLFLRRIPILRHSDAFVTNFTAAKFCALYCRRSLDVANDAAGRRNARILNVADKRYETTGDVEVTPAAGADATTLG